MNSKQLLLERQSTPILISPSPSDEELDFILNSGMRVPDHGGLTPWFFTLAQGTGLEKLSQIFKAAAEENGDVSAKIEKAQKMPFRAPLIIVISTRYQQHSRVPKIEQSLAAGCCAHAMQMAAFSLGYGAMWRTGDFTYHPLVKRELGISTDNDIIGFLYIGTAKKTLPVKAAKPIKAHVEYL